MEWWLIAAMAVVIIFLIAIYRRSLRENRELAHYALLLMLNEEIYRIHRRKLAEFVASSEAKSAVDLGLKVYLATGRMASQIKDGTLLVAGELWNLKLEKPSF